MGVKQVAKAVALAPKHVAVGYWRGLTYPFKGAKFVYLKHFELFRIWIWPIALTLFLFAVSLLVVWQYHDAAVNLIWDEPTGDDFWSDVASFFHGFVEILVALLGFLLAFVLALFATSLVAAPFNSRLSEEVEHLATGREGPKFKLWNEIKLFFRSALLLILMLAVTVGLTVASWIGGLVFAPLGIVLTVLGYIASALHASVDAMDYTAERRGRAFWFTYAYVFEHFLPCLGFGTGAFLMLFVPFLNLFFLPAIVGGGTLLYLDLEVEDARKAAAREPRPGQAEPSAFGGAVPVQRTGQG
jgi:uncharacterized protein involved in cysteine biosynthesis